MNPILASRFISGKTIRHLLSARNATNHIHVKNRVTRDLWQQLGAKSFIALFARSETNLQPKKKKKKMIG